MGSTEVFIVSFKCYDCLNILVNFHDQTSFHRIPDGTSTTQRWYHGYRGGGDAIKLGTVARRANNCMVKYFEVVCNQLSLLEPGEVPPRGWAIGVDGLADDSPQTSCQQKISVKRLTKKCPP
jgi:hypothetical protein